MTVQIAEFNSTYHKAAKEIRAEVLRKPLGLSADDPAFDDKETDVHFVALDGDEVVGVVVLVPQYKPNTGKLRQMATTEEVRGKGFGIQLVKALEEYAVDNGITSIVLNSRHYAVGFYEKLGYKITSDVFQEVGMDHYVMEKEVSQFIKKTKESIKRELDGLRKEYDMLKSKHWKTFETEDELIAYAQTNKQQLERLGVLQGLIHNLRLELMTDQERMIYFKQMQEIIDKHSLE